MEITIESTIKELSAAYRELEQAKSDCKNVVDSALDNLSATITLADNDKKAIIKVAKAMASGKHKAVAIDAESVVGICEKVGI